ncbi:MAG: transposase, partial [Chloroflexota bacterium]
HLIVSIPPKHAVAYIVKCLKGASSHYLTQAGVTFAWQRGYGVLTLGERQRPQAETYVRDQKVHHEAETSIAWLERYAEFDEGLEDTGIKVYGVPYNMREQRASYDVLGEPPF